MKQTKTIGIGLVGLGTVGSGVYRILQSHAASIEKKTGVRFEIRQIVVKSLSKKRTLRIPKTLLTTDASKILNDPKIQIVVEVAGGIHPAKEIIERALSLGKHVVTANKALLAEHGTTLFKTAERHGRKLRFEASVCGGIPIIKSLREGLVSNDIHEFLGIVNGTCNFILTLMSEKSINFRDALAQAQKLGYAEKNPMFDVEGIDSAHKLSILARLAFRSEVAFKAISVEGIQRLSITDIEYAKELGYVIKLLAIGKKQKSGLELRVNPALLPLDHPLSGVRGVYNAVFVNGDQAQDLLFYGRGAGMMPTASAVWSDIVDIAKKMPETNSEMESTEALNHFKVLPISDLRSRYYLRFQVADKPGVLGEIAQSLGRHHISILSVHQKESENAKSVPVVILTYEASEKDLRNALRSIDKLKEISEKTVVLRVQR
jgi:homoserine dehydrogenase